MYCKHCGKEIADNSKFCQHCGAIQESPSAPIPKSVAKSINRQSVTVSNSSYLWKRFFGSMIDKAIILLLCLIVVLFITSFNYDFAGELGKFSAFFHMSKESVYDAAIGHIMSFYPGDKISQHQQEIDNRFYHLIWVELKIAYLFVLMNVIYYAICEMLISSSLGKSFFKLKLVGTPYEDMMIISISKVLYRAFFFFLTMSGIIVLRWSIGFNYYFAVIIFFLIMDIPVLLYKASLLDILTRTRLIIYEKDGARKEDENINTIYVEEQDLGYSKKENRRNNKRFNIFIFFVFVVLVSLLVYTTYSYSDFKYRNKNYLKGNSYKHNERFAEDSDANKIPYLSEYEEPNDAKDLICLNNLSGHHISTFCFEQFVYKNTLGDDFSIYYKYRCSISTYDISSNLPIFGNDNKIYEQYLTLLAQKTQADINHSEDGDISSITWYGNEKKHTKYFGVCANERLYIIKVQSEKNLDNRSAWVLSLFDFNYFQENKNYQTTLLIITILIGISCILLFAVNLNRHKKLPILNRYAYSLFYVSLLSILINGAIALVTSYNLYDDVTNIWTIIILIGAEATAIISSLYLCLFYYEKSKYKWGKDYIVPNILKKNFYDGIQSETLKQRFIQLICYPTMILSLLPCGFYIIFIYSIPLFLITAFNRWHKWVRASKTSSQV